MQFYKTNVILHGSNPPPFFSHKSTQRITKEKNNRNNFNEKFLGVQNPFFKKGFGRRRQKLAVDL